MAAIALTACSSSAPSASPGSADATTDSVAGSDANLDGATEAETAAPACDSTATFESVVATQKNCMWWAESFDDECGKRFQTMNPFGVDVYEFDKAGKLTRHYRFTDASKTVVCGSESSCVHAGGTCTSICFTANHWLHAASCPPSDAAVSD